MTTYLRTASPASAPPATIVAEGMPNDADLLDSMLAPGQEHANVKPRTIAPGAPVIWREIPAVEETDAAPPPVQLLGAEERIQLIHDCQGIVRSLAWKIHRKLPNTVDLDDLIAYGQVGLVLAARDFDPAKGGKFTTYAYWRVRGSILDGLSQMSWFKRQDFHASKYEVRRPTVIPVVTGERITDGKIELAMPALSLPVKLENVETTNASDTARPLTMTSIEADSAGDASRSAAGSVADSSTRTPPTDSMMREMMEHVRKSIEKLPPESAMLIRAAYFEGVTLHEAGRRLGISRAWTSRLHTRALEKMKRDLRSHWSG